MTNVLNQITDHCTILLFGKFGAKIDKLERCTCDNLDIVGRKISKQRNIIFRDSSSKESLKSLLNQR